MLSLADPVLGELEKKALIEVIDSGWLTMGERVRAFESAFAAMHGVDDAVAVSSCTAGLHLALTALGIGPGDEVLVPSMTFVATVNAVLYTGATPVFVDIESLTTPHISLEQASLLCSERTKSVIVMHYGGYPVDMSAWKQFSDERGLLLIEDAAHAPGAPGVGLLSDASAYSFFSNKNMTTGEGGMVIVRNKAVHERIRAMRTHGMTTTTLDRHKGHAYSYDVTMLGFNYRMDEARAAMGLVQLERLSIWNQRRIELSARYRKLLGQACPKACVPFSANQDNVGHLMPIVLPEKTDRQRVMDVLREAGIQSSIHYPPVHWFSYYQSRFPDSRLPMTEQFSERELSVPLHPSMQDADVDRVVEVFSSALSDYV